MVKSLHNIDFQFFIATASAYWPGLILHVCVLADFDERVQQNSLHYFQYKQNKIRGLQTLVVRCHE